VIICDRERNAVMPLGHGMCENYNVN